MESLRRWVGVVALMLAGITLALFLGNRVLFGVVMVLTLGGCAVLVVHVLRNREDPYDLSRLNESAPMPEDGFEGPEDKSGYCPVCGSFVESPYEPCPKCGSAV
jgi:hypothetical protein